jgi:hypothetical protein
MDDREALARVAKMKADKEAAKAKKEADRKTFLSFDLPLEEMLRQSRARKNYMASHRFDMSIPDTLEWGLPARAASRHQQFEDNIRQYEQAEALYQAALRNGDPDLIKEHRKEADKRLSICLFASYAVGMLYRQFVDGAQRRAGLDG